MCRRRPQCVIYIFATLLHSTEFPFHSLLGTNYQHLNVIRVHPMNGQARCTGTISSATTQSFPALRRIRKISKTPQGDSLQWLMGLLWLFSFDTGRPPPMPTRQSDKIYHSDSFEYQRNFATSHTVHKSMMSHVRPSCNRGMTRNVDVHVMRRIMTQSLLRLETQILTSNLTCHYKHERNNVRH